MRECSVVYGWVFGGVCVSFTWCMPVFMSINALLPPANEVWGKVIFSEACVKNSVHRGEYLGRSSPGPGTPPGQVPLHQVPPGRYTPPDQVPPGRYTPLGRYTPRAGTPGTRYLPPGTRSTPSGSSACWEIRATSGRYSSYWNAFLLLVSVRWCMRECMKIKKIDYLPVFILNF